MLAFRKLITFTLLCLNFVKILRQFTNIAFEKEMKYITHTWGF